MKNYIKFLAVTLLTIYAIVSFVNMDYTALFKCEAGFRGLFLFISAFISAIVWACYEDLKSN